jgi:hypothetical protein
MSAMIKTQVALVDLGERLPIRMRKLEHELARHLTNFCFQSVDPITAGKMGEPTIKEEWYDIKALFELLRSHKASQKCDLVVGITHAKISENSPSVFRDRRDYFCLSDCQRITVVSLNDAVCQYNAPGKNPYQYLAYNIVGEVLINLAKQNLMHSATKYCLSLCANNSETPATL